MQGCCTPSNPWSRSFPRALLLKKFHDEKQVLVIGAVESGDRAVSAQASGATGMCASCGYLSDAWRGSVDELGCVESCTAGAGVDLRLCTAQCTTFFVVIGTTVTEVSAMSGGRRATTRARHAHSVGNAGRRGGVNDIPGVPGARRNRRERTTGGLLRRRVSALGALADTCGEFLDVVEDFAPLCHLGANLLLCVHDRGVVASEGLTDLGQ